GSPTYNLTLASDTAGSTLPTARAMELSGAGASTIEFVGPTDGADFYRLNVPFAQQLNVFLSMVSDTITLSVIRDANSNGIVDSGDILLSKIVNTSSNRTALNVLGGTVLVGVATGGGP